MDAFRLIREFVAAVREGRKKAALVALHQLAGLAIGLMPEDEPLIIGFNALPEMPTEDLLLNLEAATASAAPQPSEGVPAALLILLPTILELARRLFR